MAQLFCNWSRNRIPFNLDFRIWMNFMSVALFIFCEFLYLLTFYFLHSYSFILQNLGHEIGSQRDSHFIFRASDFLLTFNLPTFRRRAIGPSIYFLKYFQYFQIWNYLVFIYTVYFFPLNFQSSHFWSDEGNWPINLFLSK